MPSRPPTNRWRDGHGIDERALFSDGINWRLNTDGGQDAITAWAMRGGGSTRLSLAAGPLKPAEAGWEIDMSLSFDETDWHGASVVAVSDGMLVGVLAVEDRTGRVLFIPPELVKP